MTLKPRQARGYVLIMVLMVLLVLTLLVAGLYSASEDGRFTAQTMMAQRVAAARADQAAQLALATVRAGLITNSGYTFCTGPVAKLRTGNCAGSNLVTSGVVNGPAIGGGTQYENGAGQLYQWWIYKQANPDGSNPTNRADDIFSVYAEGYFGQDDTYPSFTVAAVIAEITVPGVTGGPPNFDGDYGVIH